MTATPPSDLANPEFTPATPPVPRTQQSPQIARLFDRLHPSQEAIVLLLAVLIGGGTGMGVVTFHYLIKLVHGLTLETLLGSISRWGWWTIACIPTLGGVVVGLMRWLGRDFGPGISTLLANPQPAKELFALRPVTRMVAASVSLGTGASLGPEGPSVEIGANFGLLLGQVLRVSQERLRLLLGAGAAAGLAAGFNAPIAGVFFALEVALGTTFASSAVSVVLLAAVVSSLIAQMGLGSQPAFALPAYDVRSPLELPLYIGLGLFASLVSIAYTESVQFLQRCFRGEVAAVAWLAKIPVPLQPVLGGACVGLVAIQIPQVLGIGYETVEAMLRDVEFSLSLLLILLVVKLLMTAISLGSGLVGGLFAPAMFLGASLGAAYGKVLVLVLPFASTMIAAPPAYAMVGMAAVLAASSRAPLTAILLLFELTRDYRIVLPLMAAVGLSVWLVDRLRPPSSNDLSAQSTGLTAKQDRIELLRQIPVVEAMYPTLPCLPSSLPVLEAGLTLTRQQQHSALVLDETEQLIGIVTLQDINRAIVQWKRNLPGEPAPALSGKVARMGEHSLTPLSYQKLSDICTREILYAYSNEPLADALDRMAARGLHQLPVVDQEDPTRVIGTLAREGVELACSLAITRDSLRSYLELQPKVSIPSVDAA